MGTGIFDTRMLTGRIQVS